MLAEALQVHPGDRVAFVGAGGKTTAAWRLMAELSGLAPVLFTTTTQILEPRLEPGLALLLTGERGDPLERLPGLLAQARRVVAAHRRRAEPLPPGLLHDEERVPVRPIKLTGFPPALVDRLAQALPGVTLLVEADGARRKGLKAPAPHEPVIPASAGRVVLVASLEVVGRPLEAQWVHRAEVAASLLGEPVGVPMTPERVARLLAHPAGGLKGVREHQRVAVLLTQEQAGGDGGPLPVEEAAGTIAQALLESGPIERVVRVALGREHPVLQVWRRGL